MLEPESNERNRIQTHLMKMTLSLGVHATRDPHLNFKFDGGDCGVHIAHSCPFVDQYRKNAKHSRFSPNSRLGTRVEILISKCCE